MNKKVYPVVMILIFIPLLMCGESSEAIKDKLETILKSDLEYLVNEIKPEYRLDSAYYDIESYKEYEGKYSAKAEVVFHIMEDDKAVVLRKYRYDENYMKWERYFNKYKLNPGVSKDEVDTNTDTSTYTN